MNLFNDPSQVFRFPEVLKLYNVSKPTLYRWIKKGTFPPPISLGGPGSRAKGWLGPTLVEHQRNLAAGNNGSEQ
jgi:predicted DNA-binding transcriptional regulator AlpA